MGLTMKEKQAVTRQFAITYKRPAKKHKGRTVDTLIDVTDYNRPYVVVKGECQGELTSDFVSLRSLSL